MAFIRNIAVGALGTAVLAAATGAWAGPVVTAGGKAATPTKYIVTFKSIEFRRTDGTFFSFFSGSSSVDLGSGLVQPGGTGGRIGEGVSFPAGSYNGLRVTVARDFTASGSALAVGPGAAATCSTGGAGNTTTGGYTIQNVNRNGATADRVVSIPPQADAAINGVTGMAIVGAASDLQMTTTLPTFTVQGREATQPNVGVKFDVANTIEFLNDGANCYVIILPPTVTFTDPAGATTTLANPI